MKILTIIPARGGSKGIPKKNINPLLGKPLIYWSIDAARNIVADEDICVSTDCSEIAKVVEAYGLKVPFMRPDYLATDHAGTLEVLLHAINHYAQKGILYDVILLLQPTSPLRTATHIREALSLYTPDVDMVVSVTKSHAAAVIVSENEKGYLELALNKSHLPRQEMHYWEYNGAIYVINVQSLLQEKSLNFQKKIKYEMDDNDSIDIDTPLDIIIAEEILKNRKMIE